MIADRHHTRRPGTEAPADDVILLADDGTPIGRADRVGVHTEDTPLHLAFSTYIFNAAGEVLVTRRALAKKTWPGVWTNSCCGHPRPGEALEDAARRRIREELGLHVGPLTPLLPDFRYRATDASGIVENEICPVYAAFVSDEYPQPDPDEVSEWRWVPWEKLADAIEATPHVYSPWAALQIPRIAAEHPEAAWHPTPPSVDVGKAIADVDALLAAEIGALALEWREYAGELGLDVLPVDLPQWLSSLLIGHGKRLRVSLAYWGFIATGGAHGSPGYRNMVRISAALETLHLFALIHDDVMDESDSRRGRPSAHRQAEAWHRESASHGDPEVFGRNLAVLLGDLAHTVADRLVDGLPPKLRDLWYILSVELIAGQRADLTGAAASRRDRAHAEYIARAKTGRYTVARPLQLGATAAGAPPAVVEAFLGCGDRLGLAFALRDEHLGVWGDPEVTGKPAGDDLLEGKPTVLLSIAKKRLTGHDAELLAAVGTPRFGRDDVAPLAQAMREAGAEGALETMIDDEVREGLALLEGSQLAAAGVAGLRATAHALAWRDA